MRKNAHDKSFCQFLRAARDAVGLRRAKVAQFVNMSYSRLKNLEYGYFNKMPPGAELMSIAELYEVDEKFLRQKAQEFIDGKRA